MTKAAFTILAALAFSSISNADDFSKSQDHLNQSGGRNTRNGTAHEQHSNDFSQSQRELSRRGPAQRPKYESCQDAKFGTELWRTCRQINGK